MVYRAQQTANTILQVDSTKPQFEDVKVREAFFKAINIDQQKQIAWNGLGYEEDPAGSLTLYSFQPGYTDSLKEAGWKFDVEGAKKLLDEAGWTEGSDGIREKDGVKLSVVYPIWNDSATQKALAQSLQAQQKAIGIDVKVEVRPGSQFSEDYTSKNWDVSDSASPRPTRSVRPGSASCTAPTLVSTCRVSVTPNSMPRSRTRSSRRATPRRRPLPR